MTIGRLLEVCTLKDDMEIEVPIMYRIFKKLYLYYIYDKAYGDIESVKYLDYEGFRLTLPLSQEVIQELEPWQLEVLYLRHLELLSEQDIKICLASDPRIIPEDLTLPVITKENISILLVNYLLDEIVKFMPMDHKDMKLALICDDNDLSELILGAVYNRFNYLTLISENPSYYDDIIEGIFDYNGLMVLTNDFDVKSIDADIIINLSNAQLKLHHVLNKGIVFIDFVHNVYLKKNIENKRKDIIWIDDFTIKARDQCIRKEIFEMILYIEKPLLFRELIHSNYRMVDIREIEGCISSYHVAIHQLYNGAQMIKREKIVNTR
ncbi:hypothetical protein [Vallitalea okinawensis]|uniref:hypothetical protein n=1 Tax=Vallitalea okinawensis TaxID=2078660 RepID=UPI000CFE276B|nr:hypothetical protein [Vallitalea okinawensis]